MNTLFNMLLTTGGIVLIVVGVIMGVHETSYVGIGCTTLGVLDGSATAAFNRLDAYLAWLSGGQIKAKRPTP